MASNWQGSHSRGFPTKTRQAILNRDPVCSCRCCPQCTAGTLCLRRSTEADHITPVADGGSHDISNGRGMCSPCHLHATLAHATTARARKPRATRPPEPHPGLA